MGLYLVTGSYRTYRPDHGVPVATSVGQRGLDKRLGAYEKVTELAPYGIFNNPRYADPEKAFAAYIDRLDGRSGAIMTKLADLAEKYASPLVLMCWEVEAKECHRSWAAQWFRDRHGLVVPEATDTTTDPSQPELPVGE